MSWTVALQSAAAIGGTLVGIAGVAFTYNANRRTQYDRVLAETAKLTSGDIVADRHLIGSALEAHRVAEGKLAQLTGEQNAAFFNVLWTFERLYALYLSLTPVFGKLSRPQRLLLLSSRGAIQTWTAYSKRVSEELRLHPSLDSLTNLEQELQCHKLVAKSPPLPPPCGSSRHR